MPLWERAKPSQQLLSQHFTGSALSELACELPHFVLSHFVDLPPTAT